MTSAKLVSWLKEEGDAVTAGDIIAEVETDKTNVELEAPGSGILEKIHVQVGQSAAVGDLLAVIGEPATAERSRPRSRTTAPPDLADWHDCIATRFRVRY